MIGMRIMPLLALLAATTATAAPIYHIDLGRYFPSAATEHVERESVLAQVNAYTKIPASALNSPSQLLTWLKAYDRLSEKLQKHDIYVYLRAEENMADSADAEADGTLGGAMQKLDHSVKVHLVQLGATALRSFMTEDAALAPYGYFIQSMLREAKHLTKNEEAVTLLADPALDSLAHSYRNMRPVPAPLDFGPDRSAKAAFEAKSRPYAEHEATFAALLTAIVHLERGKARLEGFASAPAAYFSDGLTTANRPRHSLCGFENAEALALYRRTIQTNTTTQSTSAPTTGMMPSPSTSITQGIRIFNRLTLKLSVRRALGIAERLSFLSRPCDAVIRICSEHVVQFVSW